MVDTSYTQISKYLFMGGNTAWFFLKKNGVNYNHWIHCALEEKPIWQMADYIEWIKLKDKPINQEIIYQAEEASDWAAEVIKSKLPLLITCMAGLNRSGLVTALTLMKLGDKDPIWTLRRKRSPYVLFNKSFEKYVVKRLQERPII
jgi:protein-tyrosine phosphatase